MGKKYIVELEDGEHLYKTTMNAFSSPVMRSAEKIPYIEPDLNQIKKETYEKGYESGFVVGHLKAEKSGQNFYEDGYKHGLADAWEAARKIGNILYEDGKKIFGVSGWNVFEKCTAAEAIEKLKAYEQEQEEIKPGDEFENGSGQRFVVLSKRNKEIYRYIDGEGRSYVMKEKYNTIRKTGRSFPEVVNMLEGLWQPTSTMTLEERTAYEIRIQKLRDRLTEFCRKQSSCANCPLNTNEFSCGKGLSFKRMYDDDEKIIPEHDIEAYAAAAGLAYGSNP